jgi:hypothetical protein
MGEDIRGKLIISMSKGYSLFNVLERDSYYVEKMHDSVFLLTMALPVSASSKGSNEKTTFVHPKEAAVTQEVQGRWMLKEKAVFTNNTGKESWTQNSFYIDQPVYTKAAPEPQIDFSHFGEVSYLPDTQTVMLAAPDYTESYYIGNT